MLLVSKLSFAADLEMDTFRKLVDPVIYSSSYQVPENLDYIKYIENNDVPASFKERMRYVKNEMLEQMVAAYPQLCRPDYETAETGCLSPLRGSEYYLVYDKGKLIIGDINRDSVEK